MKEEHYDVVVLGVGGMGSATAWALARRGVRVCGIEQFGLAHALGSSHGEVRVIRKAYFEHPDYVPLLHSAYQLWEQLEAESGQQLLHRCGTLAAGAPGSELITGLERCYRENTLPHEHLRGTALRARFPRFQFPAGFDGFHDPEGGFLLVERCIQAATFAAQQHGAEIFLHEKVLEWDTAGDTIRIVTDKQTLHADRLVLTAGPWLHEVFQRIGVPTEVLRKVQLWYRMPGLEEQPGPDFPTYYAEMDYGGFYGFPPYGADGLKVAEHTGGETVEDPDQVDRSLRDEDQQGVLRFLAEVFPQVQPELRQFSVCMYTVTPDRHFVIDAHPEDPRIAIAGGFSGHGFKFAPVVGEILADLALGGSTELPAAFLSIQRFQ